MLELESTYGHLPSRGTDILTVFLLCCERDPNTLLEALQIVKALNRELCAEKSVSKSMILDNFAHEFAFSELVIAECADSGDRKALGRTDGSLDAINNDLTRPLSQISAKKSKATYRSFHEFLQHVRRFDA